MKYRNKRIMLREVPEGQNNQKDLPYFLTAPSSLVLNKNTILTYTSLHLPKPPYTNLHKPTPPYANIHLPTQTYTSLHKPTQTYTSLHKPTPT